MWIKLSRSNKITEFLIILIFLIPLETNFLELHINQQFWKHLIKYHAFNQLALICKQTELEILIILLIYNKHPNNKTFFE